MEVFNEVCVDRDLSLVPLYGLRAGPGTPLLHRVEHHWGHDSQHHSQHARYVLVDTQAAKAHVQEARCALSLVEGS